MTRPFFAMGRYRSAASFAATSSFGAVGTQAAAQQGRLLFYQPADTTTTGDDDHARMSAVPAGWGDGEATVAMKARLSSSMPTGTAINRWTTEASGKYSSETWWFNLNFLLDWFNNDGGQFSEGSFAIGFRNSGRPCVLIGDGANAADRVGNVHAVYSAAAASLIDDNEHELAVVFRNTTPGSSRLFELWVDYELVATETSPVRTPMFTTYWDGLGPSRLALGAELISAGGGTPWFKHAGGLRFLRFWTRARSSAELSDPTQDDSATGRVARYLMTPPDGNDRTFDDTGSGESIQLFEQANPGWEAV